MNLKVNVTSHSGEIEEMIVYHTESQEAYDALISELTSQGVMWSGGGQLNTVYNWQMLLDQTCVRVDGKRAGFGSKKYYERRYSCIPIIKYPER